MKDWSLARRELLKRLGLGAACLPLLRATGARAQTTPTRKLICVLAIQGYRQAQWKPAAGPLPPQTLPPTSSPLEPHKRDVIFATGLRGSAGAIGHGEYGTVLWGLPPAAGAAGLYQEPNGKTLDQVVADALPAAAGGTPALTLGVQLTLPPRGATEPGGWICSWKGAGRPVPPREDPAAVYQELFGSAAPGDPTAFNQLRFQRKSMLDYVGGSLQRFASRVGSEDRRAIEAHLEATRGLERRVLAAQPVARCGQRPPVLDLADHAQYPNIYDAHIDLVLAALGCGAARVATLQLADASGIGVNFGAFVEGVPASSKSNYKTPFRNWHDLGHNPIMDGHDHKALVDKWWMGKLATLIARLKAAADLGGTTMFDNSVVLWANPCEEGGNHNSAAMPWLLAGGARSGLRTGQHVAGMGRPSAEVLAAIARTMGVPGEPFGKPMAELLA